MVMIGSMFTSCTDSPAESVYDTAGEIVKKKYFGSASQFNGNNKNIEGTLVELDCNGLTYRQFFFELEQHLQSSISYAGGKSLGDLSECKYNIISK